MQTAATKNETSRAAYRRHLNETIGVSTSVKGAGYRARTRPYGDYLWHQDREMFEIAYQEWLASKAAA